MPNAAINQLTAPDDYTARSTIDGGQWISHFNIDVVNQAIFWKVKQAARPGDNPQMATWQAEVAMAPGSRTISRPGMVGAQFRALIPAANVPAGASQAIVTLEVVS